MCVWVLWCGVVLCACGADECNKRCSDEESSEAISRTCVLIVLHSPCEGHGVTRDVLIIIGQSMLSQRP